VEKKYEELVPTIPKHKAIEEGRKSKNRENRIERRRKRKG
jgi:hypothetical protein